MNVPAKQNFSLTSILSRWERRLPSPSGRRRRMREKI
jgi:hypothetical protein